MFAHFSRFHKIKNIPGIFNKKVYGLIQLTFFVNILLKSKNTRKMVSSGAYSPQFTP